MVASREPATLRTGLPPQMISWIEKRSATQIQALSLALIVAVGLFDYATGLEIAFSIFYFLPLALVGWKVGPRYAAPLCALTAVVWLATDLAAGVEYESVMIPIWNTVTRLATFLLVTTLLGSLRDVARHEEDLARTDAMTGLLNWRGFHEVAEKELTASHERNEPLSVVYIDLDDFKKVNDELGHTMGDKVLVSVAGALDSQTRSSDGVARLGGDEFALLLPSTGTSGVQEMLENLVHRVRAALIDVPSQVSFSAGAVTFLVPPRTIDELIKRSDALMYEAKRSAKGSYQQTTVGLDDPHAIADVTPAREPLESKRDSRGRSTRAARRAD
jgi:diguanylate cyclase (GGDEF)-like protein